MPGILFEIVIGLAVIAVVVGGLFAWCGLVILALKLTDKFSYHRSVSRGCPECDYTGIIQDPNFGSLSGCGGGVTCPSCNGEIHED